MNSIFKSKEVDKVQRLLMLNLQYSPVQITIIVCYWPLYYEALAWLQCFADRQTVMGKQVCKLAKRVDGRGLTNSHNPACTATKHNWNTAIYKWLSTPDTHTVAL